MLTPWECPGIFADDAPFAGHAKRQLEALSEIVQKTEAQLRGHPAHRCIAGYSLAGLFATWAPFQTDLFDAVASASGSMWYPTSRNTSRPASSSVRCGVHTSRLGRRRRARRAAFCAAWPTARSALSLPLRRKASKLLSKAIRATISKNPMCAWRRRFAGCFELRRGFAIETEGVRVVTRVVDGNSERFAECLRYCSFRCECSVCRRFPINVDDCRLMPLIVDRSSLLLSFSLMNRVSVFLHATT